MLDCIVSPYKTRPDGYTQQMIGGKNYYCHRLVLSSKLGVPYDELDGVTMHSCDNRKCINPDHLSLGTQSKNITDAFIRGRKVVPSGEDNHAARFTDEDIALVRKLYIKRGKGVKGNSAELIARFGMSKAYLSQVVNGLYR